MSYERNPLLGPQPSTAHVDMYFATAAVWNAVWWYAMPKRWRTAVPAGIMAAESRTIVRNVTSTESICGFGVH